MAGAAAQDGGRDIDATATRSNDGAAFALSRPLPAALLYHRCTAADLAFTLSSELKEVPGLIGQERAVEAISLAMRMRGKGYNVYALGPSGTGRHSQIEALLRKQAESEPTPPDWCYVNNFDDPQKPRWLRLPAGRGAALAAAMKRLVEELRAALPAAFEHEEYRAQRAMIEQEFKGRHEQVSALCERAPTGAVSPCCAPRRGWGWRPPETARPCRRSSSGSFRRPNANISSVRSRRSRESWRR